MRHTTRLMSLGVMAAFCLTLAAADDKPATDKEKEVAKERADAIDLIVEAERLEVKGDVSFGKDVKVSGSVTVENDGDEQLKIDDGEVLEG